MDNPTILRDLAYRLDNKTLSKLALTSAWSDIKSLFLEQYYWYLRLRYQSGEDLPLLPNIDWRVLTQFYLSDVGNFGLFSYCLSSLNLMKLYSLLTAEQENWRYREARTVADLASLEVLKHAVANGLLIGNRFYDNIVLRAIDSNDVQMLDWAMKLLTSVYNPMTRLSEMSHRPETWATVSPDLVRYILNTYPDTKTSTRDTMISMSAISGNLPLMKFFVAEYRDEVKVLKLLDNAIQADRPEVFDYLLSDLDTPLSAEQLRQMFETAWNDARSKMTVALWDRVSHTRRDSRRILDSLLSTRSTRVDLRLIKFVLTKTDPNFKSLTLSLLAIALQKHSNCFSLIQELIRTKILMRS